MILANLLKDKAGKPGKQIPLRPVQEISRRDHITIKNNKVFIAQQVNNEGPEEQKMLSDLDDMNIMFRDDSKIELDDKANKDGKDGKTKLDGDIKRDPMGNELDN